VKMKVGALNADEDIGVTGNLDIGFRCARTP
jgi:hypothetical protein